MTKWLDVPEYRKVISIDDVLYGFAGANMFYEAFLREYDGVIKNSDFVLDNLIEAARKHSAQFYMIRFDRELALFAYSPKHNNDPEIYRISKDPRISKTRFAIGSGQYSGMYKKFRNKGAAPLSIRKIIGANNKAIREHQLHDLAVKGTASILSTDEAVKISAACNLLGGDLATGGNIQIARRGRRMKSEKEAVMEQAELLAKVDAQASANGLYCASPFNAREEAARLESIGQPVHSEFKVDVTPESMQFQSKLESFFSK
jgi:hypothetical protein